MAVLQHRLALQQYLPFTVLKPNGENHYEETTVQLQQYLPFTVLKLSVFDDVL